MGRFSGIGEADTFSGGRWLVPGHYVLRVDSIHMTVSTKPATKGQEFFIVELTVLSSTLADFLVDDSVSWVVAMKHGKTALGNIKGFAIALLGDETEVNEEVMEGLCGPEQPATGIKLKAEAYNITTTAGDPFTKINWSAVTA